MSQAWGGDGDSDGGGGIPKVEAARKGGEVHRHPGTGRAQGHAAVRASGGKETRVALRGGASAGPPGVCQAASVSSSGIHSWAWAALPGRSPRAATPDDTEAKLPEQIEGGARGGTRRQRCDSASAARPLRSRPRARSLRSPLSSVSPPPRSPRALKGVGSSGTAETQSRGWLCTPGAEAPFRACAPPSSRPLPPSPRPGSLCPSVPFGPATLMLRAWVGASASL